MSSLVDDSEGEVPELQYADGHVKAEKVEALEIAVANAGLSPAAVVIHFILTFSTGAAVMNSGEFIVFADGTIFVGGGVSVVIELIEWG